jgi:hypothetical protein
MNLYESIIEPDSMCFDIGTTLGESTQSMLDAGAALVVIFQPDEKIANNLQFRFADDKRVIVDRSGIGEDVLIDEVITAYGIPQFCMVHNSINILFQIIIYPIMKIFFINQGVEDAIHSA